MGQIGQAFDHIKDKKEISELSAVLYADSFFCGYWSEESKLLKADAFSVDKFKDVLQSWNSDHPDASIKIMSTKIPYVHLPQAYYDEEYFQDYFKGIFDLRKRKKYEKELDNFIKEEIHTLHYVDQEVVKDLSANSLPFKMAHVSTAMSNYCTISDLKLLVYIESNNLHIVYQKDAQFRFYNQFYCVDVNDYLYFILMVIQNFGDKASDIELSIGGEISRSSKLYTGLKAYFSKMNILDEEFQSEGQLTSPSQIYFDLFLCKSCV